MQQLQIALEKARETQGVGSSQLRVATRRRGRKTQEEIEAAWESIPQLKVDPKRLMRKRLVALEGGSESTSFDVLRTKVLQLMEANGWRRVAITSAAPGSGKTTTSANLAVSIARQIDLRVMLMDMDMRRPALAKAIGFTENVSVAAVLEERSTFSEQARRIGKNLAIGMNYTSHRDPSDLFLRQRTSEVIDMIEDDYQPNIMIFDMPPMMVNDDTSAFLRNVDCAIVIAEAGVSTINQIDITEKELSEQTNVLGIVLNKCRFQSDGYGYYYYNYGY